MARLSLPTSARLPSSIRVDPTNGAVTKALNRLSRPALLSLVLDWLDEKNLPLCPPLLRRRPAGRGGLNEEEDEQEEEEEEDDDEYEGDFYPPARSVAALRALYADLQQQPKPGSKREVVDRIVEGDWRHGLSLYQLAMADLQHLYEHPGSLKWTAFRMQRLRNASTEAEAEAEDGRSSSSSWSSSRKHDKTSLAVPRFHPSTFLQNLQAEVPPDVKAHYNFDRPPGRPLLLLRVFVLDSPYSTSLAVSNSHRATTATGGGSRKGAGMTTFDAARTIYIAFPDASPHVYISAAASAGGSSAAGAAGGGAGGAGESRSLRALVIDSIPKALSRPRERYTLVPTGLSTRNLDALLHAKGAGRTNAAGGGWGVYASASAAASAPPAHPQSAAGIVESPLNPVLLPITPPLSDDAATATTPTAADEDKMTAGKEEEGGSKKRKRKEPVPEKDPVEAQHERAVKRAVATAQARFGGSARADDGKGVERLDVQIEDEFSATTTTTDRERDGEGEEEEAESARGARGRQTTKATTTDPRFARQAHLDASDGHAPTDDDNEDRGWRPRIRLAFHGPHVFAGIRQLVEAGVVDGERMPGWMTGEEGVTIGTIRHGRVRGHRGAGL